ncbi:hypothetical protein U2261_02555 [Achromobacter xylosoxidans]|jgi:hypothetical protein|uniref:Uncharacterized protein n=2 Tax=Pseudomonadota TaxID=1224 RepID=A0A0D6IH98_ALCXX|nr:MULTISPECIES: hypothetical protein [Achromobacter]AHC49356.1 hypothetical protein AX27061_4900 [Achromobacter xylosoxidans NBRC 15126 = ATCC 27061]AMH04868.1 hypothetical protein AL509_06965 [Achromobacter xylosoxidans]AXA79412.1 hypothetical protein CE206_24665 [Achromobacter xylosoxidans]EFV86131.1 hypothetical protein HMPREF0005_02747 [Achromobacter xylosoxidans C54]KAA5920365.1 hypothetical protein F1536_25545 [Achromobacter xylosoxidans]
MDLTQELKEAADQLSLTRRRFAKGEEGLRLLHQSREAFINSLRNTGLTYAEAKTKYDNCLDDQEVQLHDMLEKMRYAERMHQYILHRIALQQSQDAAALRPEQAAAPA